MNRVLIVYDDPVPSVELSPEKKEGLRKWYRENAHRFTRPPIDNDTVALTEEK